MSMHIDAIIDKNTESVDETRTAKITRTESHGVVGVPVFFTAKELKRQGIDPEDLDRVAVRIEDGLVLFEPVDLDSQQSQ